MPFYALIQGSGQGSARIHAIRADEVVRTEYGVVFIWDGRIVHQAPSRLVSEVRTFETAGDLYRFIDQTRQEQRGMMAVGVRELGVARVEGAKPRSTGSGVPAESVGVSAEGMAKAPRRRK
jgi:hypothetical protein